MMLLLWFLGFAGTFAYVVWATLNHTNGPVYVHRFWNRGMPGRAVAFFILVGIVLTIISAVWFISWPVALFQKYRNRVTAKESG